MSGLEVVRRQFRLLFSRVFAAMKVLYHHRIASKDGQYVHLKELSDALIEKGHELIFVGPKIIETDDFGSDGGVVQSLKKATPKALYELMEFSYSFLDFIMLMYRIFIFRPDVIYERCNLFFVSGIWAKKLTGIPLLLEVNSPLYQERAKFGGIALPWLAKWSENYTWSHADYTLPVTEVLAEEIRTVTGKNNQVVIHNGINIEELSKLEDIEVEALRQELGIGQEKTVLGFTGFVREWHKIEQVIDLIHEHADERLVLLIVGDGPARESLESHARRLGVESSVIFTGIVQRDMVYPHVQLFDVALQPAVTYYASPLKMFEYLALGKVIVAPDENNIREILTHNRNGLLFDKAEPDAFKAMLEQALSICADQRRKAQFSKNARDTISEKHFTWSENAQKVGDLFQQLTRQR